MQIFCVLGLTTPPNLNKLNPFITRMALHYYTLGLELDIVNSKLRITQNDSTRFPGNEEKCREMLSLWLDNDESATWEKLCKALERIDQRALAGDIREIIRSI